MTTAVRSSNSKIWHLTDNPPTYARDEGNTKTICGRSLAIPDKDRDGHNWKDMHTWPAMQPPNVSWTLCPKCGTMADFMAASQERWAEQEAHANAQAVAREKARALATEKTAILADIWQQTLDGLKAVGWQFDKPQYRRYRATMQVNGFNFEMELVRPDTAFGINTATGEVTEVTR